MPVRMKDIARDLNVSVVTVSKVLRNHEDISRETRERVLKRIRELNYRPNLAARALVTGKTFMVGFIVPDLVHPFFSDIAKGLAHELRKKGYGLVIACSEEDGDMERDEIDQLLARRVDALVIASMRDHPSALAAVQEQDVPYVMIDRRVPGLETNFVGVDDEAVGRMATLHLIDQGCERVAHLRGPNTSTARGRLQGYQAALAERGLPFREELVVMARSADESADIRGYEAMQELLRLSPQPDGVFCYNDPTALGALKAILEAGLRVPKDVAVIGAGNVRYAPSLRVPLSSVDQHSREIGVRAAALALKLVSGKKRPKPKSILLEPELVVRESSLRRA